VDQGLLRLLVEAERVVGVTHPMRLALLRLAQRRREDAPAHEALRQLLQQ
jgi:hypothetical protein